jgi:hypothetical protein
VLVFPTLETGELAMMLATIEKTCGDRSFWGVKIGNGI